MSATSDDMNNLIDPEAEVKKLQDLVKKLEIQNQILRNNQNESIKTGTVSVIESTDTNLADKNGLKSNSPEAQFSDKQRDISSDDIALIDIDITHEDEENWLYKSPKKLSPAQKSKSPYKWLREEFEKPSPEFDKTKRSLLNRLDEMARVSRSSSCGALANLLSSSSNTYTTKDGSRSQTSSPAIPMVLADDTSDVLSGLDVLSASSTPVSNGAMPAIRQPLVSSIGSHRLDTGTFTRPKRSKEYKRRLEYANSASKEDLLYAKSSSAIDQFADSASTGSFGSQEDLLDADVPVHKFSDVTDVQVLARMQEESLRQSFTSPHSSPRKSFSRTYNKSGLIQMKQAWASESENISPNESTRSSPGRFDSDRLRYEAIHKSNNSLASGSSQSSSPPDSPYTSQYLEAQQPVLEKHRRSLPNLSKSFGNSGLSVYNGSKTITKPQKSKNLGSRQASPGRALSPSPGRTLSPPERSTTPSRTLSPHRGSLPVNRLSAIPRPGSASRLPTPRSRSGIPSPRKMSGPPRTGDDSWKEGCY